MCCRHRALHLKHGQRSPGSAMNQVSGGALVLEVVEDFDAAFDRIDSAQTLPMKRRALRELLGHLYTLREHRRSAVGKMQYDPLAASTADGRTAEGLVIVRGALTHQLTKSVTPEVKDAYSDTYRDQYGLLVWLKRSEMSAPPTWKPKIGAEYDLEVAGRDVVETLQAARRFLVESAVLGPL